MRLFHRAAAVCLLASLTSVAGASGQELGSVFDEALASHRGILVLLDRAESRPDAEGQPLVHAAWALEHRKRASLRRLAELAASDDGWAAFASRLGASREEDRLAFADLLTELAETDGAPALRGAGSRVEELGRLAADIERSRSALLELWSDSPLAERARTDLERLDPP